MNASSFHAHFFAEKNVIRAISNTCCFVASKDVRAPRDRAEELHKLSNLIDTKSALS